MKVCSDCGQTKPFSEFSRKQKNEPTLLPYCKTCAHEKYVEYRETTWKPRERQARSEAINAYGGRCVCCGTDLEVFLTFDHIYNDGADERKNKGVGSGERFIRWLKKNGYPKDRYQLLCWNCNQAKNFLGACPCPYRKELGKNPSPSEVANRTALLADSQAGMELGTV